MSFPSNGTSENGDAASLSDSDNDVLSRILAKRARDCDALGDATVAEIIKEPWQELLKNNPNTIDDSSIMKASKERYIFVLRHSFQLAAHEEVKPASLRRKALDVVSSR